MFKNKNPIIGVTMKLDRRGMVMDGVHYSVIRSEYGDALNETGADVIFLDYSIDPHTAARICDGIVISGGDDIHASEYGVEHNSPGYIEPGERVEWERRLIDACDEQDVSILGICYGQQLLNVHYGGTLYQDIATEYGSDLWHGKSEESTMHRVTFSDESLGFRSGQEIESAARHHQAVKDLGAGFYAVATADDGIIEAIRGNNHFGIQWHPESDGTADQIYGEFIRHCTRGQHQQDSLVEFLPETALS